MLHDRQRIQMAIDVFHDKMAEVKAKGLTDIHGLDLCLYWHAAGAARLNFWDLQVFCRYLHMKRIVNFKGTSDVA